MREFNANINYQSNCHYKESTTTINISLPLKIPNIVFTEIKNINNPNPNLNGDILYYYNDILEFTIIAKDGNNTIKWGNVTFYYVDSSDVNQIEQQINTDPILIDINGNASIRFIPHNDGKIIAKYNGDPYFETTEVSQNFVLSKRPTYIKFIDYAPYLVNPKETLEMKVSVVDKLTNEPLDYGLVTFLNYHTHNINLSDDGYEKVIGNPSFLIDGQAKIRYSPIQLGTNEFLNNIELIRASYNYDNTEYGVQWKYYLQHDDYTNIAIRRNNSVNIAKPYIINDSNYTELNCTDGGLFEATEDDNISLKCEITVTENIDIINAQVHFIINGVEDIYENNIAIQERYNKVIEAEYNNELKYFEGITKIPKGIYEIYAEIQNPTIKIDGKDYELPSSQINEITNIHTNNELPIIDSLYLQSNQSESFYIKIHPKISNINIGIYCNQETIFNGILNKNNIWGKIINPSFNDYLVLNNKKCYFWIPSLNKKYTGTITHTNNELIIKPDTNIELINPNDYLIYIYLQEGIYSYQNTSKKYKTIYSPSITIHSRIEPNIILRQNNIINTYPGNIQYIINGENLTNDIINIDILIDDEIITTHTITQIQSSIVNNIPPQSVGTHTLKAIVTNNGYNINKEFNFTIDPSNLIFELNNMSKYVNTGLQGDIIVGIKNETGLNIDALDETKLIAQLEYNNESQDTNIQINKINANYFLMTITGVIYSAGDWIANIKYNGSDNYNAIDTILNFKAKNTKPYCINLECNNDYLKNRIVYSQTTDIIKEIVNNEERIKEVINYESINQKILIKSKLIKDENNFITFIHISDKINSEEGHYTINRPNNITPSEWVQYKTLEYEIIPTDTILNNFKQAQNANEAIQAFNNKFNNHNCTTAQITLLYNQAKTSKYNNLFIGYDYVKDTIELWGVEDESS